MSVALFEGNFCRENETCWSAQRDAAQWLVSTIDTKSMEVEFDETLALIGKRSQDDPRRECAAFAVTREQDNVRTWITSRNQEVSDFWGF